MRCRGIRRLQFRLQTILLLIVIVSISLAWWRDHTLLMRRIDGLQNPGPRWDTHQLTGPPDTQFSGDIPTAWASKTPDSSREWILLEYATAVMPRSVWIYETYNPGAVDKLSVFDANGKEHVMWSGTDPTPTTAPMGISKLPLTTTFPIKRLKLYLDSPNVPGWNEIDAVGLVDANGKTHWAKQAYASSSFGSNPQLPSGLERWLP